jgi:hypothetical protein
MSLKQDEVAIRCPNCGSMAAGRVSHEERMAGTAKVRCLICKRIVPVPVPLPFPQSFFRETGSILRLYGAALKALGWWKIAMLVLFWIVGTYFIYTQLDWPYWLATFLPGLPFIYFFGRELAPRMTSQLRGELGVLRVPAGLKGMSERDPIPVRIPSEVEKIAISRPCPVCGGSFQILNRSLVLPKSGLEQLRFKATHRANRMFDRVEVKCQKCSNQGGLYFDISQLDIVRRLGYTEELMKQYPKKK